MGLEEVRGRESHRSRKLLVGTPVRRCFARRRRRQKQQTKQSTISTRAAPIAAQPTSPMLRLLRIWA